MSLSSRMACVIVLVATLGAVAAEAQAPMRHPVSGHFKRWLEDRLPGKAVYLKPGVTVGGGWTNGSGTGFNLGGELSVLYWHEAIYGGLVIDGVYDWKRDGGRLMVGPEFGLGYFGIDGGYVHDFASGAHGGAVRGFVSIGIAALYVRYTALYNAADIVDFGLQLKFPLPVWQVKYPWPRCCEELGPPPRRR